MIAKMVKFQCESTLGVVQFGTSGQDTFPYCATDAAIRDRMIEVRELNETGSVNTILVVNSSPQYVFLMDGDILAGAKQNRVVNASVLLAPHSKTAVPVSCVEHGRWHHVSPRFAGTDYAAPTSLRASKASQVRANLQSKMGFQADQMQIWGRVADYQRIHGVASGTSNISDVFDEKGSRLNHLIKRFNADPQANGIAIFFGNHLACIDVFNRLDVFREYFPKILRGAAFEASAMRPPKRTLAQAEAEYRTLDFLDSVDLLPRDEQPSIGVGMDRRFENHDVTGFELVFESHLIHLAALRKPEARQGARPAGMDAGVVS